MSELSKLRVCGGAAPATTPNISRYRNRNLTKNKIFLKYFQIYPTILHFCGVGGAKINVLASFFLPFYQKQPEITQI